VFIPDDRLLRGGAGSFLLWWREESSVWDWCGKNIVSNH